MRTFLRSFVALALVGSVPATAQEYERRLERDFDNYDYDSSGGLDRAEFYNFGYSQGWSGPQNDNYFNRADSNGDGVVTLQEYENSGETV